MKAGRSHDHSFCMHGEKNLSRFCCVLCACSSRPSTAHHNCSKLLHSPATEPVPPEYLISWFSWHGRGLRGRPQCSNPSSEQHLSLQNKKGNTARKCKRTCFEEPASGLARCVVCGLEKNSHRLIAGPLAQKARP